MGLRELRVVDGAAQEGQCHPVRRAAARVHREPFDEPFGDHVADRQPLACGALPERRDPVEDLPHDALVGEQQHLVLGREVVLHVPDGDAGRAGRPRHGDPVQALFGDQFLYGVGDLDAPGLVIDDLRHAVRVSGVGLAELFNHMLVW